MASHESTRSLTRYWLPVLLLFFVPALILVGLDYNYANPAYAALDQKYSHLPTIRYMASHWGSIDYQHYISRSAPGYYILLAAVDRWITDSIVGLRFFNLLITTVLVAIWTFSLNSIVKLPQVVVLAVPFLFSDSIYTRGIWISTDNLAWLSVVALILIAVQPSITPAAIAASAFFVTALVGVRQIHAWVIPFLLIAAFVSAGLRRAILMATAMVPALMLIAYFLFTWHGLEPPGSQARYSGFSLAPFPMVFSLVGIFGSFYASALWPEICARWRENASAAKRHIGIGMAAGAIAGIIPRTSFDSFFRQSGIWVLARHTPVFFGHSPAIAVLAVCGGLVGGLISLAMCKRDRLIFAAALLCFTIVHCANSSIFERYYEPFLLIVLSFATARVFATSTLRADVRQRVAGPALLGVVQIVITVVRLSTPMHH